MGTDAEKRELLEKELEECQNKNKEVEAEREKVNEEIEQLENELDTEDERRETADERVKQLEMQVLQVGNNLRTMEISEDAANQRETTYIDSIKKLGEDYEA